MFHPLPDFKWDHTIYTLFFSLSLSLSSLSLSSLSLPLWFFHKAFKVVVVVDVVVLGWISKFHIETNWIWAYVKFHFQEVNWFYLVFSFGLSLFFSFIVLWPIPERLTSGSSFRFNERKRERERERERENQPCKDWWIKATQGHKNNTRPAKKTSNNNNNNTSNGKRQEARGKRQEAASSEWAILAPLNIHYCSWSNWSNWHNYWSQFHW